ncbi:MAG: metallophosphoesterase [Myxococcales bacterium]|nr:metallophosphoesterase [Myxococcales bacterium]
MTRRGRALALAALAIGACGRDAKREVAPEAVVTGPRPVPPGTPGPSQGAPAVAADAVAPACGLPALAWRHPAVPRVVAIGDVHGDLAAIAAVLEAAGVVDRAGAWIGGATWVVQTGDVLDRGDDEQAILDWFERLEVGAAAAGGRFVWLLGNHELMNAAGDLRYVTPGGFRDFEDVPDLPLARFADVPTQARARVAALAPGGPYAKIMAGQGLAVVVGDTVFVHGGIRPGKAAGIPADTSGARCWLAGDGAPPRALTDDEGPLWDRSYAQGTPDCAALDQALAELGVARMVVGHTVQPSGISSACDDKVWRIDVGLAKLYGGPHQALELTRAGAKIITAPP